MVTDSGPFSSSVDARVEKMAAGEAAGAEEGEVNTSVYELR